MRIRQKTDLFIHPSPRVSTTFHECSSSTYLSITKMPNSPAVVIVPGAWHCPQHYQHLINQLAKFNYTAIGVILPSVNSSPPLASWDQDAQAVRQVIMENLDAGKDVIAVAHSFGGIAMSEAVKSLGKEAREKRGLKQGVLRLVYMCAMALAEGQTHLGQTKPRTPEEEELERQRQEYGEKHRGMQVIEVCVYNSYMPHISMIANNIFRTGQSYFQRMPSGMSSTTAVVLRMSKRPWIS